MCLPHSCGHFLKEGNGPFGGKKSDSLCKPSPQNAGPPIDIPLSRNPAGLMALKLNRSVRKFAFYVCRNVVESKNAQKTFGERKMAPGVELWGDYADTPGYCPGGIGWIMGLGLFGR